MIARCISYTGDHATVVLEPCWLARLCGARTVSIDLERKRTPDGNWLIWRATATERDFDHLPNGAAIRNALDFREVGSPSRWQLGAGTEAISP